VGLAVPKKAAPCKKLGRDAEKALEKLDKPLAQRILKFLYERVAPLDDSRSIGEALKGSQLG